MDAAENVDYVGNNGAVDDVVKPRAVAKFAALTPFQRNCRAIVERQLTPKQLAEYDRPRDPEAEKNGNLLAQYCAINGLSYRAAASRLGVSHTYVGEMIRNVKPISPAIMAVIVPVIKQAIK